MNKISPIVVPLTKIKKHTTLPKELIYKHSGNIYDIEGCCGYTMFKTANPNLICRMISIPEYIDRDGIEGIRSLYIFNLYSLPPRQGLGSKMLNFAEKISLLQRCNGYFHLESCGNFAPNQVPHVFYRKFGMSTDSKAINKELDKFVKKGKNASSWEFENVTMYYPPIIHPETDFEKFIKSFKNLVSTFTHPKI